ncbi:MAG TPA: SufS family cysteine desulfurase [Microthrixaceae bacterium]|nr:SufS family cysteine desulfurase [Microthrixaceae bacterium]
MATNQTATTSPVISAPADTLDVASIKADFPILKRIINDKRLVFLDSAASSQRPSSVLAEMDTYYEVHHANVHRAAYSLAEEATNAMEGARRKVARFIGCTDADEIVFTKNATESLNLVARSWGAANLGPGDSVLLTQLEHHANIVPWQQLAAEKGFQIRWIPLTSDAQLDLTDLDRLLDGVKLLAVTAMSNVVGTLTPVRQLADAAHAVGALVAVDACQFVPHLATDVHAMGADFLAFSGHKMLGPTGVGVLWAHKELLEAMPPFLGGGGMILDVRLDGFVPAEVPHKFEAGTPPIAEIVGLGAAIDYLNNLGMDAVRAHEIALTNYAIKTLNDRFGERISIYGPHDASRRGGVMSLAFDGIHPHDLSQVLNDHGVCVRPGHHCAKPLMRVLEVGATARASWYIYNDESDIDELSDALEAAGRFFTI